MNYRKKSVSLHLFLVSNFGDIEHILLAPGSLKPHSETSFPRYATNQREGWRRGTMAELKEEL